MDGEAGLRFRVVDEGIVFGVARSNVIARSESDEAISRLPRSFQSLAMTFVDYPFIPRVLEVGIVFGVARAVRTSSNGTRIRIRKIVCSSLRNFFTPENFGLFRAQIETPPPISSGSSDSDLL